MPLVLAVPSSPRALPSSLGLESVVKRAELVEGSFLLALRAGVAQGRTVLAPLGSGLAEKPTGCVLRSSEGRRGWGNHHTQGS